MANTLLTVDKITKRALVILHQKLNFIGRINRQYENAAFTGNCKVKTV